MADKKITAMDVESAPAAADLAHLVTDIATNATNKKITLAHLYNRVPTFLGFSDTGIQTTDTGATGALTITGGLVLIRTGTDATAPAPANGTVGQFATFVFDIDGGGVAVITPATLSGGTSVTLTDVGDSVSMVYTATRGWVVINEASGVAPVTNVLILTKA
jgi:hypothetical protein